MYHLQSIGYIFRLSVLHITFDGDYPGEITKVANHLKMLLTMRYLYTH